MKPPLEIAREIWRGQPVEKWAAALEAIPEKRDGLLLRHAVRQCLLVMRRWSSEGGAMRSSTVPGGPPPDPASWCELSGECVVTLGRMGRK